MLKLVLKLFTSLLIAIKISVSLVQFHNVIISKYSVSTTTLNMAHWKVSTIPVYPWSTEIGISNRTYSATVHVLLCVPLVGLIGVAHDSTELKKQTDLGYDTFFRSKDHIRKVFSDNHYQLAGGQ